ncbi:MAG: diacylglycerol kinase family lipid kinase [Streptosporangiales bacterium]|nr:diacylglycerol kinase family lipid kinase [Streptosporangiales bacterium]
MRAVLVVNPNATTTTSRTRDVLCRALASETKLDIVETRYRGHAAALAQHCVTEEVDALVVLGGDGTVNEVVNGLLAGGPVGRLPALAVIPGGSTNVFARALGLPSDAVEATGAVIDALRSGRRRPIGLGQADDRYFTFCSGLGLDAEIVRAAEALRSTGLKVSNSVHQRTAVRYFFTASDRRHPPLAIERPGQPTIPDLFCAIVQNTAPWTYAGKQALNPCPDASFDTGLDVFSLRTMRTIASTDQLMRILGRSTKKPGGRSALVLHDMPEFTVTAVRPLPHQVDGEYLGERERVTFRSVPEALDVVL